MANNGVELVWDGKRKDVERVALPFQRVEIINESRATRRATPLFSTSAGPQLPPDPLWTAGNDSRGDGWRNKLIWGDNKYVLASLLEGDAAIGLEPLAGKVDLIYIDPPFITGRDFSFRLKVGEDEIVKEQSILEELAYRDTWGQGAASYLQMLYDRLLLAKELLAGPGTLYLHIGWEISHYVKALLDQVFGPERFLNQIIWKRQTAHSDVTQGARHLGRLHDVLLIYCKQDGYRWNMQFASYDEDYVEDFYRHIDPGTGRRYQLSDITAPAVPLRAIRITSSLGLQGSGGFRRNGCSSCLKRGVLSKQSQEPCPDRSGT